MQEMTNRRNPRQLSRAASQWREEDLDEIMALLEKDYTKPQPKPVAIAEPAAPVVSRVKDDELDEIRALLEKDYTKPQSKPAKPQTVAVLEPIVPAANQPKDDELDEIRALLEKDYTEPGAHDRKPTAEMPEEKGVWKIPALEVTPKQKQRSKPEKAKPVEKKEKKPLDKLTLGLTALAGVESAALVGMIVWLILWL